MFDKLIPDPAPPQPSKAELQAHEAETASAIRLTATAAVVLYFCKLASGLCRE